MKKLLLFVSILILAAFTALCTAAAEDAVSSATLSVNALPQVQENENASVLVVYFSTDDTIRAAALTAADALSADVFEIVPTEPYTADDLNYNKTGTRATVEQRDSGARPGIAILPESLEQYGTILLGYPIWWGQAPKIIYTFLESVDVSGKTIIPFCTSASSSVGSSDTNLHALADDTVNWLPAKRISNRETAEGIRAWALSLDLPVKEESHLLYIKIRDVTLTATLTDNSSAAALVDLLRQGDVTIDMHDYGNFEKVGELPIILPANDENISTEAGDLILYLGHRFVIYYDHNRWDFTRLGKISDVTQAELKAILGEGDVTVVLSLKE